MFPFLSSLGASSPSSSEAPSAAAAAPPAVAANLGAPSGITAPLTGAGGHSAPVEFQCAVGSCRSPQADWHTGFCEAHHERYMDRVYDMTREVGRGQL